MAKAKLLVREVGQREFTTQGEYFDVGTLAKENAGLRGEQVARNEGERLCQEGNVTAFQVWVLSAAFEREYALRDVTED